MREIVLQQIVFLHKEMREEVLESGVKEKSYDKLIKNIEKKQDDYIVELLQWLDKVKAKEYQQVLEIKRLLPKEIWKRYKEFGEEGLREQVLLEERQKILKKEWTKNAPKAKAKSKKHQTSSS